MATRPQRSCERSGDANLTSVPPAYYDRDSDIAYFEISDIRVDHSSEHEWGLLDLDAAGNVVGAEYWNASRRLPNELLAALPAPPALAHRA
jgi:uncharacterized protein YuzE